MFIGGGEQLLTLMFIVRYVVMIGGVPVDWADCPEICQCKWISGKKTALCREAGFTEIPNVLNTEMQVLDLTGNSILNLSKEIFRTQGLVNLQRIYLKNNKIRDVHKDAFKELTILIEVDLSENFITTLHQDTFTGNERLRVLYMNGNPIFELKSLQFPRLPHLKVLEFQRCQLNYIHRDAFLRITSLESLHLNENKLNHISETTFLAVPKLKTLILDGNPWNCDCRLRSFRNWILQSKLYSHSLVCTYPPMSVGKHWEDVDPNEFACAPKASLSDIVVQAEFDGNVTLKCNVIGDPEPNVRWSFSGILLDNENGSNKNGQRQNYYFTEEENTNKEEGKISFLTIFNITESDAGDYSCKAENIRGSSVTNISVIIPKDPVATTMKRTDSWFVLTAFLSGSIVIICCMTLMSCVIYIRKARKSSKKRLKKTKLRKNSSFAISEQDRKLLDGSISTTDRPTGSCEGFGSQQDMELMEQSIQSIPIELRDQPVHITIESHATDPSISVFPPPPDFTASILPPGAYGNIFISVSVGDHRRDPERTTYPDLLDASIKTANSVRPPATESFCYFSTLPRRGIQKHLKVGGGNYSPPPMTRPQYDNMGPRITADGSSTISLPDTISLEEIPTPPPPPICSPLKIDYVPL